MCTSSKDDIPTGLLEDISKFVQPYVEYIPGVTAAAPRYVAVDDGNTPLLRAIDIRERNKPEEQQLKYISQLLHRYYAEGFRIVILSSSIESDLMGHIVRECAKLKFEIVGTVGSSPTVHQFIPYLKDLTLLILNLSEAQTLASVLNVSYSEISYIARGLSEYVSRIIVTRGAESLYAYSNDGDEISYTPPILGEKFVNDLGAGDTFVSFIVDAYMSHQKWLLPETIGWATTGAVLVCQTKRHIIEDVNLAMFTELYNSIINLNTR